MIVKFTDLIMNEEIELDTRDIQTLDPGRITGHAFIENTDGLVYEVTQEDFYKFIEAITA